jgi:hypothetical protein
MDRLECHTSRLSVGIMGRALMNDASLRTIKKKILTIRPEVSTIYYPNGFAADLKIQASLLPSWLRGT